MTRLERFRRTVALRLWAYRSIRLLAYIRPRVVEDSPQRCVIRVPLSRRTRNHLGSMYFGALCTGADAAAAWIALSALGRHPDRFSILFKDVRAEFIQRAEGAVDFACEQVAEIGGILEKARASGVRESLSLRVTATVPARSATEPVARFELTLSVKRRGAQTGKAPRDRGPEARPPGSESNQLLRCDGSLPELPEAPSVPPLDDPAGDEPVECDNAGLDDPPISSCF